MKKEKLAKVVIIGEAKVGKTSILTRYTEGNFHENMIPTLGIFDLDSVLTKQIQIYRLEIDGVDIKMQIWDTAGQERFRAITQNFYKAAMGIILVFDLNDQSTLETIKTWLESIKIFQTQEVVKVIFANKYDLEQRVSNEQILKIEQENNIPVFQISAKTNYNIDQGFNYLAREIKKLYFSGLKTDQINEKKDDKLSKRVNGSNQQENNCNC